VQSFAPCGGDGGLAVFCAEDQMVMEGAMGGWHGLRNNIVGRRGLSGNFCRPCRGVGRGGPLPGAYAPRLLSGRPSGPQDIGGCRSVAETRHRITRHRITRHRITRHRITRHRITRHRIMRRGITLRGFAHRGIGRDGITRGALRRLRNFWFVGWRWVGRGG